LLIIILINSEGVEGVVVGVMEFGCVSSSFGGFIMLSMYSFEGVIWGSGVWEVSNSCRDVSVRCREVSVSCREVNNL